MRKRHLLVAGVALLLGACGFRLTHYTGYHGDGSFTARPAPAICQDGYTVDLGAIDLAHATTYDYTLAGLPPIQAIVGIALRRDVSSADGRVPHTQAQIEITLRDADGHIVIGRNESLAQWTAEYASARPNDVVLYRRGESIEVPTFGGTRYEPFPLGRDDSWGSYFTPRRGARYALHFAVLTPDADRHVLEARLQVRAVVGCL